MDTLNSNYIDSLLTGFFKLRLKMVLTHKKRLQTGNCLPLAVYRFSTFRGILVYKICLISISNSVSDGATNKSVLNI